MIFSLAVSSLMVYSLSAQANAALSDADKIFLTQQCNILSEDVEVISRLPENIQVKIAAWVAARDTKEALTFKNTRDFCRAFYKVKMGEKLPPAPAPWSLSYLTKEEHEDYVAFCMARFVNYK